MHCPYCNNAVEYVIATQLVHVNVKVDGEGNFIDNLKDGDLYDSAYAFDDPVGDYQCPVCGEYFESLDAFAD